MKKTIWAYAGLLSIIMALVTLIIGASTKGLVMDTFSGAIIAMLILGIIATAANFAFDKIPFISIIPLIFYAIAFGLIFFGSVEPLAYAAAGVDNDVGGNADLALVYMILTAITVLIPAITLFFKQSKE